LELAPAAEPDLRSETALPVASAGAAGRGLLDYPQYTRPVEFRGLKVPEVLLSGNHQEIRRWRRQRSIAKTWRQRPELLQQAALNQNDLQFLQELQRGRPAD
jgi:tRNA (guanine37-N1)-methyltransferase